MEEIMKKPFNVPLKTPKIEITSQNSLPKDNILKEAQEPETFKGLLDKERNLKYEIRQIRLQEKKLMHLITELEIERLHLKSYLYKTEDSDDNQPVSDEGDNIIIDIPAIINSRQIDLNVVPNLKYPPQEYDVEFIYESEESDSESSY